MVFSGMGLSCAAPVVDLRAARRERLLDVLAADFDLADKTALLVKMTMAVYRRSLRGPSFCL
jgi:hypothetical protein